MNDIESLSDEDLVEIVRTRDQELYAEIVKRYEQKLLRYAMSFSRNEQAAEDIVQNTFIKAFINLQGFNTKKKFSSWIYRITHNESINEIKKHKKEVSLEGIPGIESTLPDGKKSPEDEMSDQEVKDQLSRCLNKLDEKYRSPLALHFLEEQSYEEISDILRLPMGTVGTRINRGKKMLKELCKTYEK